MKVGLVPFIHLCIQRELGHAEDGMPAGCNAFCPRLPGVLEQSKTKYFSPFIGVGNVCDGRTSTSSNNRRPFFFIGVGMCVTDVRQRRRGV